MTNPRIPFDPPAPVPIRARTPRLLDLFCGAGGCSVGYHRVGFDCVGVDIEPQSNYPYACILADALDVLREPTAAAMFDAIHASPPCQAFSSLGWHPQNKGIMYPDLIAPLRRLLDNTGLPYVIENVAGAPLRNAVQLCGSGFGLPLRRHRLFECSFPVMGVPCAHGQQAKQFKVWRHGEYITSSVVPVYGTGGGKAADQWPAAMGIDWMTRRELSQAIPPAYTEHIGAYLMTEVKRQREIGAGMAPVGVTR